MSGPLESMAKGATKGFLEHIEERVAQLVTRLHNREIAFVKDKTNIETVKKQKETPEYDLLQQYVPKGWLRILFLMGLALRKVEYDQNKVAELKDDIYRKYGTTGVHVAELAQIGVITQLLAHLVKILASPADVRSKLVTFLEQVDYLVIFVSKQDIKHVESKSNLLMSRVDNHPSHMMILFASGFAMNVALKILKRVKKDPRDYIIEVQEEGLQITAFVFAQEMRKKLTHWSEAIPLRK